MLAVHSILVLTEGCCPADSVLAFFRKLQWDGAISQSMLHDFSVVLEHCTNEVALDLLHSLTRAPAFISTLQV